MAKVGILFVNFNFYYQLHFSGFRNIPSELLTGSWNWGGLHRMQIENNCLCAVRGDQFFILDYSDLSNIISLGAYQSSNGEYRAIAVKDSLACLIANRDQLSVLEILNISALNDPVLLSEYPLHSEGCDIFFSTG